MMFATVRQLLRRRWVLVALAALTVVALLLVAMSRTEQAEPNAGLNISSAPTQDGPPASSGDGPSYSPPPRAAAGAEQTAQDFAIAFTDTSPGWYSRITKFTDPRLTAQFRSTNPANVPSGAFQRLSEANNPLPQTTSYYAYYSSGLVLAIRLEQDDSTRWVVVGVVPVPASVLEQPDQEGDDVAGTAAPQTSTEEAN